MLKPQDIVQKVGEDRIRKALESSSGEELQELLESEGIRLTPEQMDYISGGAGLGVERHIKSVSRKVGDRKRRDSSSGSGGSSSGLFASYDDDYVDDGAYTCDGRPEPEDPITC